MSRIASLTLATLALAGAGLAASGPAAAAEDPGVTYQRYADIRERLYACILESEIGWDTQDEESRADCRRLRRPYVLYTSPGEGFVLHVHCRSPQRCIPTPSGEPRADGPIPAGAHVYDFKVAEKSTKKKKARKKKKRRRAKARSRRSLAAHGTAAAVR